MQKVSIICLLFSNFYFSGLCSPSIPFIILGDVLDCFTLDACDVVFQFIEERVSIWKSAVFYTAGRFIHLHQFLFEVHLTKQAFIVPKFNIYSRPMQ